MPGVFVCSILYCSDTLFDISHMLSLNKLPCHMKTYLTLIIGLLICVTLAKAQNLNQNLSPKTLPDVAVYDINGVHTTLHQLAKNKVLFIDCWFIPCGPCFMEMNVLHKLYAEYSNNKDVCFITLCMTDSADVKKFIAHDKRMDASVKQYQYFSHLQDFKLPVYFMPGCNSKVYVQDSVIHHTGVDNKTKCPDAVFSFTGYPTSMIFDKTGQIIFKENGYDNKDKPYQARVNKAISLALAAK